MTTKASEEAEAREARSADQPRRTARERMLFERAARRHYAGVYSYLRWVCRDAALAEDLTQETFMQIWRSLPNLRREGALRTWVYRVARSRFLQHRRRAGLETVSLEELGDADHLDADSPDPQVRLERDERRRAVRRAVERLPHLYREVIVLHNLEQLSLAQIAQVLEAPIGTVKSRRAKALSMLRHLLAEQEVGTDEV